MISDTIIQFPPLLLAWEWCLAGTGTRLAGEVKARGERRRMRSDWMGRSSERGISVSSTVMRFEHQGSPSPLLDTPGHEDFSEDTYPFRLSADQHAAAIIAW